MWSRFCRVAPTAVVRAAEQVRDTFLAINPEDRLAAGGRLKKLKGRFAAPPQYDLPGAYRLWYRADRSSRTVTLEYIGPHP